MKHPESVREQILFGMMQGCERLRIQASMRWADDLELLGRLANRGQSYDLAVELTKRCMELLGYTEPPAKSPRYDKTRRALNKHTKGPRGVPRKALLAGAES
jgi:hypothetical protein